MRQLTHAPRGMTLIELMVTLTLLALMAVLAAPSAVEYLRNAKLREAAHTVVAALQFARNEAIKRNAPVSVNLNGAAIVVADDAGAPLRRDALSQALSAALRGADDALLTPATVTFGGSGRPLPFGSAFKVDVALDGVDCGDAVRCPRVVLRAGGAVRLCRTQGDC
jgi:prepilin-type N-terminal cleavage/methylation domain-containing protein